MTLYLHPTRPDATTGAVPAAYRALTAAAALRGLGCQILGCHAINGHAWVKVRMPRVDPVARLRILAAAWRAPAAVEWGNAR